jgi:hypothetical protein
MSNVRIVVRTQNLAPPLRRSSIALAPPLTAPQMFNRAAILAVALVFAAAASWVALHV